MSFRANRGHQGAPCRGIAPRQALFVLLALWSAKCISTYCPALSPMGSYPKSVDVANDTALLAAIRNQSVYNITITSDMVLGSSWASLTSPIVIQRNLSVSGSRFVSVNLGHLQDLLDLGPGVMLQFRSLVLMQEGPKLLDPGLQIIGGGDGSSLLQLVNVQITELCCYPWQMWDRFIKDNQLAYASYNTDTKFVCDKYGNCFDQQVTFGDLCSNNASDHSASNRSFAVRWSQVVMLCESSVTDECVMQNGTASCLDQCYEADQRMNIPPTPPSGLIDMGPPAPQEQAPSQQDTLTIVLATIIPGVVLAAILVAAVYLWQRRKARDSSDAPTDIWKDGFGCLRSRDMHDVESASAGLKGAKGGSRPVLHVSMKPSLSPAPTAPGDEREEEQLTGSAGGSAAADHQRSEDAGGQEHAGASHGTGHGGSDQVGVSEQVSQLAARSSRQFFNAAEAVASLAASREQRGLAGDGDLMDLQRKVQQLADQRLISEDEKLVLGRPIGRGAFGMVFHGLWRNLEVAVKTMLFSQNDGARQESALIEAALASSVVHPNVVSVYHFDMKPITVNPTNDSSPESLHVEYKGGQIDWKMYIVQELCQSSLAETLETWVFHDQQTGLPRMDLILSVLLDVACGCAHIHSKNIIWGDLKPGNVLLKMDPSKPHGVIAKITDFGMSTTIDPSLSHISNYNKGTPFYVAPEILLSHQATKTSDVFSFGILIQQMLTRSTPYQCTPSGAVEVNKQFWRLIPGSCSSVIALRRRCLDQNPKNRPKFEEIYQTLQEAYETFLVHMPLPAASPAAQEGGSGSGSSGGDLGCEPCCADSAQQQQQQQQPYVRQSAERADRGTAERRADTLEAQSVPGRSASTTITEVASQLTVLQSRLFTNWPMSDGALQGMQMIKLSQAHVDKQQQQQACARPHLDGPSFPDTATSDAISSSNGGCSSHHVEPTSSPNNAAQRDLFPHWSTQF